MCTVYYRCILIYVMEDNKVDFLKLKLEEVTKQRNFFWDSFILSIALFISGLSFSSIIAEFFTGENSVGCFITSDNRNHYSFLNSYCYKDVPKIKYFPVIVLSQSALLFAPHYGWKAIFSAKIESFLSHAAKVQILREKDTRKYPYHNYTIVKYLRREFSDSYSISFLYFLKLALQIVSVISFFILNVHLFRDINNKDITFMCKDEDQMFDKLFENESLDSVTCTYPRKTLISVLVWIDYVLLVLAGIMVGYGLIWVLRNHSKKTTIIPLLIFATILALILSTVTSYQKKCISKKIVFK